MASITEVQEIPDDGWVSVTGAATKLGVRYLKARDLMTTGRLGEVLRTESGRYYVSEEGVEEERARREERGVNTG